jgi:riboflavin synthase
VDRPGLAVNLERPLRVGDELGGHWVLGQVDGVGTVRSVVDQKEGRWLEVELPESVHPALVIEKGSIAVNGVSLTVNRVVDRLVQIQLIPYTLDRTNLSRLEPGDRVNLELDMIGKYVIRYMEALHPSG